MDVCTESQYKIYFFWWAMNKKSLPNNTGIYDLCNYRFLNLISFTHSSNPPGVPPMAGLTRAQKINKSEEQFQPVWSTIWREWGWGEKVIEEL